MGLFASQKFTHEVFGVSPSVLPDSYVDRGELDALIKELLERPTHVAIRGESKCGKSWLRQTQLPDAIVVQCRLNKTGLDLYVDALSQLGISLKLESTAGKAFKGTASVSGEGGFDLLAKLGIRLDASREKNEAEKTKPVGHDVNDLRFVADVIKASGKRLVIEDFHYMTVEERRKFAFDLKALWDMKLFVVIVGVWSLSNMLISLNPDLTGRINEVAIYWTDKDLGSVMFNGGNALNISFAEPLAKKAISICFGNVGIIQTLALGTLDHSGIKRGFESHTVVADASKLDDAAMEYAEQLNPLYQEFAKRVSSGIRKRADSTGIYAHAIAVLLERTDQELIKGVHIDTIYAAAHARQNRIQKGNLRTILEKFEERQVDEDGRGLVLSYNPVTSEMSVVDRQLLLYRRFATVKWPWEEIIREADASGKGFGPEA